MAIDVYLHIDGIKGNRPIPPIKAGSNLLQPTGELRSRRARQLRLPEDIPQNDASIAPCR